jgi:hypothetical protein
LRRHLGVLAAYAALTVLFTWPLAAQFGRAVPGGGDAWQHIWNLWWMRTALVDLHTDPFYTTYLYYPQGVSLLFHTLVPLESALTVPFQLLGVDLVPLYNGVLALSFVLAGYGTWLLVRDLTGNDGAAFVAGFAFAFCPYHLGHLLGHMNLASLQWIPLYLWALLRAAGPPGAPFDPHVRRADGRLDWRPFGWAALAGLFLAANAFTEWTYVAFLGIFTAVYLLWRLLVDGRRAGWRTWPAGVVPLLALALVFGVLAGPLLVRTAQAQVGQDWMKLPPRETLVYSSDLVDSFLPSALHPFLGGPARALEQRFPARNTAERAVYLGYTPILLALLALWLIRRRGVLFWALTAAFTWSLSLGPILHVLGRANFTPYGATVPLPYLVLSTLVPGFSVMRVPSRFVVLTSLALAVLVGYALAALSARLRPAPPPDDAAPPARRVAFPALSARTLAIYGVVAVLIALEFMTIPYPMAPPGYHIPFYEQVAQEPGRFAILELPLRPMSDYMAYQTVHGKPIVYGYLSRQPPDPFVENTPAVHYLLNSTPVDALPPAEAATGAATLRTAGIRYVVVHWWAFTDPERKAMEAKLAALFPGITPTPDPAHQMVIYTLGP